MIVLLSSRSHPPARDASSSHRREDEARRRWTPLARGGWYFVSPAVTEVEEDEIIRLSAPADGSSWDTHQPLTEVMLPP
jgi:hypothetical protein